MATRQLRLGEFLKEIHGPVVDHYLAHLAELITLKFDLEQHKRAELLARLHAKDQEIADLKRQLSGEGSSPDRASLGHRWVENWVKVDQNGRPLPPDSASWAAVFHEKSGLMWAVNPPGRSEMIIPGLTLTYDRALQWVEKANQMKWCGFSNWRLPTFEELKGLQIRKEDEAAGLSLPVGLFPDIPEIANYTVWSYSNIAVNGYFSWVVNFTTGGAYSVPIKSSTGWYLSVRLVRSGGVK